MRYSRYGVALTLLWFSSAGAESVDDWLMKINNAVVNLNYQGVFVYAYESRLESMRVVHQVNAGSIRERIYSLNDAPREIIRSDKQVWCYVPEKKIGVHEFREASKQSFPNILPQQIDRLSDNYDLALGRVSRIAERVAQQILILPLDEYRYGYALWADQETGLLLKSTLVDIKQRPIERYMFTQISIDTRIPDADLLPLTPKEDLQWFGIESENKESNYAMVENPGWKIESIPDGFKMSRQIKRLSPIRKKMMEHYVYTDGLAAVSVFIEMIGDKAQPQINGVSRIGAVHAFGHAQDGYHITVVGEVPSATVDMMGMSVTRISH